MQTQIEIERVKALCKRDAKYETILRNIISTDRAYENDSFGWQFKDIQGWSGAHVNILMQEHLIIYGYKSNSATHYRLAVDGAQLEQIVNEVEQVRIEAEQKHVQAERLRTKVATLSPELVERFETLIQETTDVLDYWCKYINPKIEGMENTKKAIMLSLASHGDKFGDRGRIHLLMHGDPGGAKSQLMNWVVYQIGAEFCSQRTTKVGLTGSASGEEITPGAIPKAHGRSGILCIDELDKFSNDDRQALLESMEEGKFHIEAGGLSGTLDAEIRVIASANKIDKFSPELLDRFDFKIEIKAPGGENEKKITCSILDHWFENKEGYGGEELGAYLRWIKSFEPMIPKEIREKAKLLLSMYIDLDENIRGSMRKKESIMRVAFTIAKLNKRNVEIRDFITAIKLLNPNLNSGKVQALEQLAAINYA